MELSPSWEAENCAATQELPSVLWNPKFITPFTRALHWSLSWARSIPSYLSKIHFNIVHLPTSWSSQWPLSFWISRQYSICIPLLPHFSLRSFIQRMRPVPRLHVRFRNKLIFYGEELLAHVQPPSWRTIPCRLSATAYSIHSQLPSIRNLRTRLAVVTRDPPNMASLHDHDILLITFITNPSIRALNYNCHLRVTIAFLKLSSKITFTKKLATN
jgi:hypothetical protein